MWEHSNGILQVVQEKEERVDAVQALEKEYAPGTLHLHGYDQALFLQLLEQQQKEQAAYLPWVFTLGPGCVTTKR
jgi:hypothetical protein